MDHGIFIFILSGEGCKEHLDPNTIPETKPTLCDSKQTLTEGNFLCL